MLSKHLLQQEADADNRKAVALYVEILLRNNHPDSHLMLQALERLRDEWETQKLRDAADRTLKATQEYLEKNPCRPCLEATGIADKLFDARENKLLQMNLALPHLRKFIEGERQ